MSGFLNYHAVPTNSRALSAFRYHVTVLWHRTLRRRSQRDRIHVGAEHEAGGRLASKAPYPSSMAKRTLRRQTPKEGAVCGKAARTVLCGGRPVMGVPTAICIRLWHYIASSKAARLYIKVFPNSLRYFVKKCERLVKITNVMKTVFDAPVRARQSQQLFSTRPLRGETGDRVDCLNGFLAAYDALANGRPAQRRTIAGSDIPPATSRLQPPGLDPAVALFNRFGRLEVSRRGPYRRGGKRA